MSCIPVPEEGGQWQSIVDRLVDVPNRLLTLLRATGLAAATDALVRVKSHYLEVDMTKIKGGADTTKDLYALELEVGEAATKVAERASTLRAMTKPVAKVAMAAASSS
jgi:hypothetical protein